MEAKVTQKVIVYGKNHYRYTEAIKRWDVLMWGWWYDGGSRPDWRWSFISPDKVPQAVKDKI